MMQLPYYMWYEAAHAMLGPARAMADSTRIFYDNRLNPLSSTPFGRQMSAACELFERTTRRYGKPIFGIASASVNGVRVPVNERIVWEKPFCKIINFDRQLGDRPVRQPKLLIVAPMSGHYATLLRGTGDVRRHP
jgi:poly(3-hydroxybutyrate) depolymerase